MAPLDLPLPQTAADLLEGLLRSKLFAESISGQILEQSRPFLKFPAQEYASALVQRKVLTRWQAGELLAGRTRFYSGTFRLLGKLATGSQSSLFIAEQSGAQRLVILDVASLASDLLSENTRKRLGAPVEKNPAQSTGRHPHLARVVQDQTTAHLRLTAYEFVEAICLKDIVAHPPPLRSHAAHLILQLASLLPVLSHEALAAFDPSKVLFDSAGQLKWLAGPRALENDWSGISSTKASRTDLQIGVLRKFSKWLGALVEIECCRNPKEVTNALPPIAEPWTEAFPPGATPCTRAILNRMLRKGPSLQQIESFHSDQQIVLADLASRPTAGSSTRSAVRAAVSTASPPSLTPEVKRDIPIPTADSQPQLEGQQFAPNIPQTTVPARNAIPAPGRARTLLLTAMIGAIVSGILAMQWLWRGTVPEAKAQTESLIDSAQSQDRSR